MLPLRKVFEMLGVFEMLTSCSSFFFIIIIIMLIPEAGRKNMTKIVRPTI